MHLYLHIPFCKQACHYCDFHFSTQLSYKAKMVDAMCKEIELNSSYLVEKNLETLYFGGGTPSLLSNSELEKVLKTIQYHYSLENIKEFTLEANPDDIHPDRLQLWKELGVTRISLGIQTFNEVFLKFMNRAHTGMEGERALQLLFEYGFEHSSADLIYAKTGYHLDTERQAEILKKDIEILSRYPLKHVSAYHLTIEPDTVFSKWKLAEVSEEYSVEQYKIVTDTLGSMGYEQYEVSNFAKDGSYAIHNSAYWKGHEYLGIGPSAHSYNGNSRQWNIAHNHKYMSAIEEGRIPCEVEILSKEEKLNDYLLTGLRTIWGVSLKEISRIYLDLPQEFRDTLARLTSEGLLVQEEDNIRISPTARLLSDKIASELFIVD
ncbi:radical SAM family heme chaperone HemW [Leadbetterella byssophila]|uniref:radical SAM family heme chaperone HemW n=1 Tax=Leadbetterella byssophila TaxID=316068 RepID=UPI0039A37EB6